MPRNMKILRIGTVVAVALAVVGGFFIVGSPMQARLRLFDSQRVNDLQNIQNEVVNYWQRKSRLPESLSALHDDIRGFVPPVDPATKAPYEYAVEGPLSFSLCATFAASSTIAEGGVESMPFSGPFYHGPGRTCFTRTIDTDLYPPIPHAAPGGPVPMKPVPVVR